MIKRLDIYIKPVVKNYQLLVLALPAIVFLFIFNYIPMAGLIIAFKNINYRVGLFKSPWVGLDNFKFFFTSSDAWLVTRNTLLYNLTFIVFGTIIAVAFALMLDSVKKKRLVKAYQTLFFLPYFFSWIVVAYMVYAFISEQYGIVNSIFKLLGKESPGFYTNTGFWPIFLVFISIWKNVGYSSVIYYAGIMGISVEYYEAAAIDGASRFQMITKITLPLLTPLITILTLLSIGKIFYADFGLFYFVPMDVGSLFPVTQVIDTYVYRTLKVTSDLGMSSAAAFYQSIMGFIVVMISNYCVKKGNAENALF